MIIDGEDGVTHINIYSKGRTVIGRWLSNFTYEPIKIEDDGYFPSIESYWYFLKSDRDERFHKVSGFNAKNLYRTMYDIDIDIELDTIFIQKIKHALDLKLKVNRIKMEEFGKSHLPFCHYYVYGDKRRDAGYEWIIEHFELRRKQLKEYYGRHN